MGYKTAFKDVMKIYEEVRENSVVLLEHRKKVLHERFPRLVEIEKELAGLGINMVKQTLSGDALGLDLTRAEVMRFNNEKNKLFLANNIPDDYLTAMYLCNACKDTGYLLAEAGQVAERCSCLKQKLIESYYSLSNIMTVLHEENFDTFDHRYFSPNKLANEGLSPQENIQAIHRIATLFVSNFDTQFDNLLFYGPTGLGKTFICHCIAKDLLDAGYTVLYLTAPRLFKIIEDYRFNREALAEPDEMLDAITDVDLLILDDLGAEFMTIVTSSALFDLVNQRLLMKKPTVISTNLLPDELEQHYSERIVSRFTGYFRMLKFIGEDVRIKKKYGGRYAAG